jgi:hypothetical protein
MFKKAFKPKIEIYSTVKGLEEIEEARPQPSNKFIPSWWKDMPKQESYPAVQTVKVCPSFPEYFSQGIVVPMWADTTLIYDEMTTEWKWTSGMPSRGNPFTVETHPPAQFTQYVKPTFQGEKGNFVFKFNSPWRIRTPKGYSVLQLPLYYHFNNEFSVLPGVIHTDFHTEINQQVVYYGKGKEIFIKRGTPLVQYIPFKRTKFDYVVRSMSPNDTKKDKPESLNLLTKFIGSGAYKSLHMKREREVE